MATRAWRVRGRVQGVGFRWNTVRMARGLGLEGRVWNRADGSVEVHARGDAEVLGELEEWLRKGPPMASVTGVEPVEPGPEAAASGFEVLRETIG